MKQRKEHTNYVLLSWSADLFDGGVALLLTLCFTCLVGVRCVQSKFVYCNIFNECLCWDDILPFFEMSFLWMDVLRRCKVVCMVFISFFYDVCMVFMWHVLWWKQRQISTLWMIKFSYSYSYWPIKPERVQRFKNTLNSSEYFIIFSVHASIRTRVCSAKNMIFY